MTDIYRTDRLFGIYRKFEGGGGLCGIFVCKCSFVETALYKKGEQCGQALFPGRSSKSLRLYARSALREQMSLEVSVNMTRRQWYFTTKQ